MIRIKSLLAPATLAQITALLGDAPFVDGRSTAGASAAPAKRNEQVAGDAPQLEALRRLVVDPLVRHPLYRGGALPARLAPPLFARYSPGMAYGEHVDSPLMGDGAAALRSDLSITVFLNAPSDYGGGELVIEHGLSEVAIKLEAGDALLYASDSRHRVAPVTRGERLVAVTWVQSLVADAAQREVLFKLLQARDALRDGQSADAALTRVEEVYGRLVRMWARP